MANITINVVIAVLISIISSASPLVALSESIVAYCSTCRYDDHLRGSQNDSLRLEFPGLMADVEPFLHLAREAFGNEPDAVNLWIGDERSMSSVHKDHYEVSIYTPSGTAIAGVTLTQLTLTGIVYFSDNSAGNIRSMGGEDNGAKVSDMLS